MSTSNQKELKQLRHTSSRRADKLSEKAASPLRKGFAAFLVAEAGLEHATSRL